jgi:uncharacterized membrane protein
MMSSIILPLHIAFGFSGFMLGAIALWLPKFGRSSSRHRLVGRAYALCMLGMAMLSIPLSLADYDYFLLTIGLLTLSWVAGGWTALRLAQRARQSNRQRFVTLLRAHIILMGSSYIAAWTAFLVNVGPLGSLQLLSWVYALGPTVIGTVFISRASARFVKTA